MTSRERMLAALSFRDADYVPCCLMTFAALRTQCQNAYEYIERQMDLGLDATAHLPAILPRFHADVTVKEWKEQPAGEPHPILHRVYHTPAGDLSASVRQTEDWPFGDHVPLFGDLLTPRSTKFLITEQADLEKFQYLLLPPSDEEIRQFRARAATMKRFAETTGVLLCAGRDHWAKMSQQEVYGLDWDLMGVDALMWICGGTAPLFWSYDQPGMLEELIQMIATWNRRLMEIYLDEGVDLMIRRGWYEGADFWSPRLYQRFISPVMKQDIELTHQAGAKFGYIIASGVMPLLDELLDLKVDVMIGVDPVQGKGTDMRALKERSNGKLCLWGGVNGFLTVERGTEDEVEEAVANAFRLFAHNSGFVLSPVDNVTANTDQAWRNVHHMIDAWKDLRGCGDASTRTRHCQHLFPQSVVRTFSTIWRPPRRPSPAPERPAGPDICYMKFLLTGGGQRYHTEGARLS